MLCLDCQFVSPASNGKCSICGSSRFVSLSQLLELLVAQAYGAKGPIQLRDLANTLVGNNSVQRPVGDEPSRFELWPYFEA
jgi:hypothetical protein